MNVFNIITDMLIQNIRLCSIQNIKSKNVNDCTDKNNL